MRKSLWLPSLAVFLAGCAPAAPELAVSDGWARATTAMDGPGVVYLTVRNRGGPDRLVNVASPRAMAASLHSTEVKNGIARMRPLQDGLPVPEEGIVTLRPNGPHIMLTRAGPLTPGERFPVILVFERSGPLTVEVEVKPASGNQAGHEGAVH
jgi:copper(I)-binding protein